MYCVFFFKQKTAYEMRISDWSSDVCSSDLPVDMAAIRKLMLLGRREQSAFMLFGQAAEPAVVREIGRDRHESKIPRAHTNVNEKIGRASCRERVCQYV